MRINFNTISRSLLLLVATSIIGCASTTSSNTIHGNTKQILFYPKEEFQAKSDQMYAQIIVNNKVVKNQRVDRVAKRLISNAPYFRSDAKDWNWEYHVLQSNQQNAFCAAGGKIVVYTGLLDLGLTDDELAVVMSHEIAHALREHSRAEASRMIIERATMGLLAQGLNTNSQQIIGLAEQLGVNLPNSRSKETEADLIGVELMARSGYNPKAAETFWLKMMNANKQGSQPLALLSTHPASQKRIDEINKNMPYFLDIYQKTLNNDKFL